MNDEKGGRGIDLRRVATIVGAWIALGVVASVAFNAYGDYRAEVRSQAASGRSGEQTASVDASGTKSGEGTGTAAAAPTVLVLAEGLNLREKPDTSAKVIKKLKKGASLALVEKGLGWYRVRDAEGAEGWVAAGGQYSKLVE